MDSALEKAGNAAFPDFALEVVRECSSTQDLALQKAAEGAPEGFCVVAMEQTAGRGRQGRSWVAPPGSSLLCSLVLRPEPGLYPLQTLLAGLVVARAVVEVAGVEARLKWPNDVLVDRRKVAGILAEARGGAVILGIGVNLTVDEFPPELLATSLHGLARRRVGWEEMLAAVLTCWTECKTLIARSGPGCIVGAWRTISTGLGEPVAVQINDQVIHGTAVEIQPDGALLVKTENGLRAVYAGDVHLMSEHSAR